MDSAVGEHRVCPVLPFRCLCFAQFPVTVGGCVGQDEPAGITQDDEFAIGQGELAKPETRKVANFLKKAGLEAGRTLILSEGREPNFALSCRNIPRVEYKRASNVNAYDLALCDTVVFTRTGLERAIEVFK